MISGPSLSAEICPKDVETLRLPKGWPSYVRNAVLNVVGIVGIAMLAESEAMINNIDVKDARIHQLECEVAMLRGELRINGSRMQRIAPPGLYCLPTGRMIELIEKNHYLLRPNA